MQIKFKKKYYETKVIEWKDLFPPDKPMFTVAWFPKEEGTTIPINE